MSKVYEVITDQILAQLAQGMVPWARPWTVDGLAPSNLVSRRPYRGINVFLLGFRAASTPWWLTFRQAKALGGAIRAGERSTPVIFWRWIDRSGRETEAGGASEGSRAPRRERLPVLRYYSVFNLDQCRPPKRSSPASRNRPRSSTGRSRVPSIAPRRTA